MVRGQNSGRVHMRTHMSLLTVRRTGCEPLVLISVRSSSCRHAETICQQFLTAGFCLSFSRSRRWFVERDTIEDGHITLGVTDPYFLSLWPVEQTTRIRRYLDLEDAQIAAVWVIHFLVVESFDEPVTVAANQKHILRKHFLHTSDGALRVSVDLLQQLWELLACTACGSVRFLVI